MAEARQVDIARGRNHEYSRAVTRTERKTHVKSTEVHHARSCSLLFVGLHPVERRPSGPESDGPKPDQGRRRLCLRLPEDEIVLLLY